MPHVIGFEGLVMQMIFVLCCRGKHQGPRTCYQALLSVIFQLIRQPISSVSIHTHACSVFCFHLQNDVYCTKSTTTNTSPQLLIHHSLLAIFFAACATWCASNKKPWKEKCAWSDMCSGCQQCLRPGEWLCVFYRVLQTQRHM